MQIQSNSEVDNSGHFEPMISSMILKKTVLQA